MAQRLREAAGSLLRDVLALAGAAAVTYGAWTIYEPAGWIVGGLLLMAPAGSNLAAGT